MTARILTVDIESTPNVADVWGLWQQNISLSQLRESTRMMCFAAKWYGDKKVLFASEFHDGKQAMLDLAHSLLDEADAVITYNGVKFDIPHLNREFLEAGMTPPSPSLQIDLFKVAKSRFKFPSNKLQYVSTAVGLPGKVQHEGHSLWVRCLAGDEKAWAAMRRYNKQDVVLTEQLYDRLLPWIGGHPHVGLINESGEQSCSRCGSTELVRRGYAYTSVSAFQRFRCSGCGAWSRGGKAVARVELRGTQ